MTNSDNSAPVFDFILDLC